MLRTTCLAAAEAFAAADTGVSAVEFSLIAPILLAMFMATIEIPRAYMVSKRLDSAAATMADLISRGSYSDLTPVYAAASAIGNPYDVGSASIVLTAAGTYLSGTTASAMVCSSAQHNGQARAVGSSLGAPPKGMTNAGDRFVLAEVQMHYTPLFPFLAPLTGRTFKFSKTWPVRAGTVYFGQEEVVLPGGKPCPLL